MSKKLEKWNRPFKKSILNKAKMITDKYEIIMTFANNEYYGRALEMPTVFGDGKTPNECFKNTKEALTAVVAHLLEIGEVAPSPASGGKRDKQVNVRLTSEEKTILTAAANSRGFKGLGDFIRAKALTPLQALPE